ncbi:hypothetical protein QJS04_geneDACA000964 [Acorus gramineus]|uniref:prephenate dehydratase n=1 Tax=Acorus gramineus TaxID=55184 RepID=A0AAV9AE56_ACOGR|nr:hypothetical protein QJS04_geneDACA000964 [Acorus gramineus]
MASFSACSPLELPHKFSLKVAYQGVPGAYSELAARTACPGCFTLPCRTLSGAVLAVESGEADRAVLPVESTMDGTALRNYDLLLRHDVRVAREITLFVRYCLLAMPGVRKAGLRRVMSHPVALAHCGRALDRLGVDREPVEDTAGAVRLLSTRRMFDAAAIASARAGEIYGLDVIDEGVQDEAWNTTRFLIVSRDGEVGVGARAPKKTSMVVAHAGDNAMVMLRRVLSAFASRGVNLTKLEVVGGDGGVVVRKGRRLRAFARVMVVDFEGSVEEEENVREAVKEVEGSAAFVRVLGCYASDRTVYNLE